MVPLKILSILATAACCMGIQTQKGVNIPGISLEETTSIHNQIRHLHKDTKDLQGSEELQDQAAKCAMSILDQDEDPCKEQSTFGINMGHYKKFLNATSLKTTIVHWYHELRRVNFTSDDWALKMANDFSKYANGSQIIWKGTTHVGCGGATKAGIPPASVFVCLYNPAGNKMNTVSSMDLIKNLGAKKHPNKHILHDNGGCKDYHGLCKQIPVYNEALREATCDLAAHRSKVRDWCPKACGAC
eukprot:TCONS_00014055-protein